MIVNPCLPLRDADVRGLGAVDGAWLREFEGKLPLNPLQKIFDFRSRFIAWKKGVQSEDCTPC